MKRTLLGICKKLRVFSKYGEQETLQFKVK